MNGPQHYLKAESLLADAARWENDIQDDIDSYGSIDSARLAAQVHATLALAAATATSRYSYTDERTSETHLASDPSWNEVIA